MAHVFYGTQNENQKHYIDKMIYPIALISPLMTIPQLIEIWTTRQVQGVSFITWLAYGVVNAFWIYYGIVHKEKPIIVADVLLFLLDASIVIGVLLFR